MSSIAMGTLRTPDSRYIVVRGRLWRASNPHLSASRREKLVKELMAARRAVWLAQKANEANGLKAARQRVNAAKVALGERGPVWWTDGTPDYNRHLVKSTPYREWFAGLE